MIVTLAWLLGILTHASPADSYQNPVLPGFHPDPSVCRVGDDYYLATSSFGYAPGVPIHHSRDLVHWRLVGHALSDPRYLPLDGADLTGGGIWAPTLRHYQGRFYVVTTNVRPGGGNLLVSAADPAGPWSAPIWFDREGWDPSLFFDDDGRAYLTRNGKDEAGAFGIVQYEIDVRTGARRSEPRLISHGSGGFGPEGPHLYKRDGVYYLLLAEGGTHAGHMVTVFRSRSVWGPFEPAPRNPILSHRNWLLERVQATGHGDLVQAPNGSWWMVFLGIRNFGSPMHMMHALGRETFLTPVRWDEQGWPTVNEGRPITENMPVRPLPPRPWPPEPTRDEMDGTRLGPAWVTIRHPRPGVLAVSSGRLALLGGAEALDDPRGSPTFVARRPPAHTFRVTAPVHFAAGTSDEEAGLTVFQDAAHHVDLALTRRGEKSVVLLRRTVDDLRVEVASQPVPADGPVTLEVRADPWTYSFFVVQGGERRPIGTARVKLLSTELAGGFTGVLVGLYATGNGQPCRHTATVDWFDLEARP